MTLYCFSHPGPWNYFFWVLTNFFTCHFHSVKILKLSKRRKMRRQFGIVLHGIKLFIFQHDSNPNEYWLFMIFSLQIKENQTCDRHKDYAMKHLRFKRCVTWHVSHVWVVSNSAGVVWFPEPRTSQVDHPLPSLEFHQPHLQDWQHRPYCGCQWRQVSDPDHRVIRLSLAVIKLGYLFI